MQRRRIESSTPESPEQQQRRDYLRRRVEALRLPARLVQAHKQLSGDSLGALQLGEVLMQDIDKILKSSSPITKRQADFADGQVRQLDEIFAANGISAGDPYEHFQEPEPKSEIPSEAWATMFTEPQEETPQPSTIPQEAWDTMFTDPAANENTTAPQGGEHARETLDALTKAEQACDLAEAEYKFHSTEYKTLKRLFGGASFDETQLAPTQKDLLMKAQRDYKVSMDSFTDAFSSLVHVKFPDASPETHQKLEQEFINRVTSLYEEDTSTTNREPEYQAPTRIRRPVIRQEMEQVEPEPKRKWGLGKYAAAALALLGVGYGAKELTTRLTTETAAQEAAEVPEAPPFIPPISAPAPLPVAEERFSLDEVVATQPGTPAPQRRARQAATAPERVPEATPNTESVREELAQTEVVSETTDEFPQF